MGGRTPDRVNVHWLSDDGSELLIKDAILWETEPRQEAESFRDDTIKGYKFPVIRRDARGNYPPNEPQGKVRKSICAQAISWEVSLRVDHTEKEPFWESIRLMRCEKGRNNPEDHNYELAVPILDPAGSPEGVVSVKHGEKLDQDHLRCVELICHLYRKVSNGLKIGNQESKDLVRQLTGLEKKLQLDHFQIPAKRFCRFAMDHLRADLVWLLLYDSRFNVFRPMGMTASQKMVEKFLQNKDECMNLSTPRTIDRAKEVGRTQEQARQAELEKCRTELKNVYRAGDSAAECLHGLIEQAIITRLRPGQRPHARRTWEIFSQRVQYSYIPDTSKKNDDGKYVSDAATRYYARTLLGLPFCHDSNAQPDGVLWVGWSQPKSVQNQEIETWSTELQPAVQVTAAMCAVYQFFDYSDAFRPLPFWE